ncbi:MAG: iron-sulfur cluster assembly scaffold protein [Candidatus Acidiferrum sp.]
MLVLSAWISFFARCSRGTAFAILSKMFSEAVLDHFRNPRNAGELPGATATVEVSNPVCGDILKLAARIAGGRIAEARFLCRGCTTSIACASVLTEQLRDRCLPEARNITADSISEALGGLPSTTFHGAQLAADALSAMLQKVVAAPR